MLTGCIKAYIRTLKVCDKKMYVEIFNTNPAGVNSEYVTDSLNFRMYVGKVDEEHEDFVYRCSQDSLIIEKFGLRQMDTVRHTLEIRAFSIAKLKSERKFE